MATTFVIYQALTQDFVPRSELLAAVALNGVAINLARAIGPALAGLIIAALSAGALFAVEAGLLVVIVGLVALRVRPPGRCVHPASGSRPPCAPASGSFASPRRCAPCSSAAPPSRCPRARSGRSCRSWRSAGSGCRRAASDC